MTSIRRMNLCFCLHRYSGDEALLCVRTSLACPSKYCPVFKYFDTVTLPLLMASSEALQHLAAKLSSYDDCVLSYKVCPVVVVFVESCIMPKVSMLVVLQGRSLGGWGAPRRFDSTGTKIGL